MGRRPRIEFKGALYHVIQRGNNKEYIFKNNTYKITSVPGTMTWVIV